jgi:putative hydrolase of the HAD superfamily
MIKAIIFDLDDTLFNEFDYVLSGYKAVNKWITNKFKVSGFYETAIHLFKLGERKLVFNKTLEYLNIKYDEKLIKNMVDVYRKHYPDIEIYEDAKWVLSHINRTVKIGLISDGYLCSQKNKLKALNIKDFFQAVVLTDHFGKNNWKPSPFPYEHISKLLKCSHHECVYIGDNPSKDFITAKKLGWITVQIKRENSIYSNLIVNPDYHADFFVKDLRDLPKLKKLRTIFL